MRKNNKLSLSKETVRRLTDPNVAKVAGGLQTIPYQACTGTNACPTTTETYSSTDTVTDASCNVWCIVTLNSCPG